MLFCSALLLSILSSTMMQAVLYKFHTAIVIGKDVDRVYERRLKASMPAS